MVNLTVSCSFLSLLMMVVVSSNIIIIGQIFLSILHNLSSLIFDYTYCQVITRFTPQYYFTRAWRPADHRDNNIDEILRVRRYEYYFKVGHEEEQEAVLQECAVCLCKIEEGSEIRELRCDHLFHRVCLDRWMGYRHRTCPLCRDSLSLAPFRAFISNAAEVIVLKFSSLDSSDDISERWWLR